MKNLSKLLISTIALSTIAVSGGVPSIVNAQGSADSAKNASQSGLNAISFCTKGNLSADGSIIRQNGMTLDSRGVTRGILELNYQVTDAGSVSLLDHTYSYFKMPEEFFDLMDATPNFAQYISGSFKFSTMGGQTLKPYDPSDISIVGDHLIRLDNGRNSAAISSKATTTIDINLGKAVTDTKTRIPDAYTAYTTHATTSTNGLLLNWKLIGDSDALASLDQIPKIDPGYGYENWKPNVNDLTTDDTIVSGKATPNARINVYNDDQTLIGHTVVPEDGIYAAKIEGHFLPLQEYQELSVTQDTGIGESNPTVVQVKPGSQKTSKANFKTGRWNDPSFLDIDGEFSNSAFDFSKAENTKFTLKLKNSRGNQYKVNCQTNALYGRGFDGFQGSIKCEDFKNTSTLPDGSYIVSILAENNKGTSETPLLIANNNSLSRNRISTEHHVWTDIESKMLNGRAITFVTDAKGNAVINITTK